MSAREKAIAKAKLDKKVDEDFFERTGIRDETEDWKMGNMINEYKYMRAKEELQEERK